VRTVMTVMLVAFLLTGCEAEQHYAPVTDVAGVERIPRSGVHRVSPGETFYSIAWRYGLDYRSLAEQNGMKRPYHVYIGEVLYLRRNGSYNRPKRPRRIMPQPAYQASNTFPTESMIEPVGVIRDWHWPARGALVGTYSAFNKGINIAGELGEPVYAAAAGKVVYSGKGLRSYGNLIIIKHNSDFLTAYAHNRKNLVREGSWVKVDQKIAEMGNTGASRVILHFEIRRGGEPVNPLSYLEAR
jgi:lipoprotein NlpD